MIVCLPESGAGTSLGMSDHHKPLTKLEAQLWQNLPTTRSIKSGHVGLQADDGNKAPQG